MTLVLAGLALAVVGALLAANVLGLADRAARWYHRTGFLAVNSEPATWRFTGAMFVAVGVLVALWGLFNRA
jgi:hypothetical protein